MTLPTYQCHKRVQAAKITSIPHPLNGGLVVQLPAGAERLVPVPDSFWARNKPQVGGYLVKYEDGYQSYSPAAAFESGYTLVEA